MANLNHVVLIGRLTRDAELKYTNTGLAVSKLSIAVNRRKRSGDQWVDEANYFDITVWGKTAENLNQYLLKGKEIAVEGELRQDRWEQDGQTRSKVEIVATNIQLLGGGSGGGSGNSGGSYGGGRSSGSESGRQTGGSGQRPAGDGDFPSDHFDDDIPF